MVVPPSLSYHLQEMTGAGVLIARHDGRSMSYSMDRNGVLVLCDFLSGLTEQGNTHRAASNRPDTPSSITHSDLHEPRQNSRRLKVEENQ